MAYKEDLRIQKTKRDLRKALFELIKTKSIDKISVIEICDTALINRMTFYKYYEDKYMLLDDAIQAIRDDIVAQVPEPFSNASLEEALSFCSDLIKIILDTLAQNLELIKALRDNGNSQIASIITNICEDSTQGLFYALDKIKKLRYPIPLLSSFIFGGITASIGYWLEHPQEISQNEIQKAIDDIRNEILHSSIIFKD